MDYEEMFRIANSMKEQMEDTVEKELEYMVSKSNNITNISSKLDFCLLDDEHDDDGC